MRVAFVINSLGAGGTERSTAVLLPRLRDRGIDATVICLVHRDEGDERSVIEQGFDVRFVQERRLDARVRAMRRILMEIQPDVVHTAIFDADIAGRLAAVRIAPVLTSLVNTPYDPVRRSDPNVVPWKLAVLRQVDSISGRLGSAMFHAVTEGVADDAVRTLHFRRDRIVVVERGRDPEVLGRRDPQRRGAVRAALGVGDGAPLVVAVGRHEYQKGHVHMIEAMRAVRANHPGAILAIAGRKGNTTGLLEAAVSDSPAGDAIRLLGHRDDVADLLAAADVFVMPSLYEGTAGAAIEALALETPIVASELAGTRGVLDHGRNALLVPPGDASELARAVLDVVADPAGARARAATGRLDFEERFTLDSSADRMLALYRLVAGR